MLLHRVSLNGGFRLIKHPPYSHDLTLLFNILPKLNKSIRATRFESDDEVITSAK